jgi:hypothetical protein
VTFLRKPKPTKGCSANGRSINTRNNYAVDGDDNDDDNNMY